MHFNRLTEVAGFKPAGGASPRINPAAASGSMLSKLVIAVLQLWLPCLKASAASREGSD